MELFMITFLKKILFSVVMIGYLLGPYTKAEANNIYTIEQEQLRDKYKLTEQELREIIRIELDRIQDEKKLEEIQRRDEWLVYMLRTELGSIDSFLAALAFCGVLFLGMGYVLANTVNIENLHQ